MIGKLISLALKTVVGRWVTASLIAMLLGGLVIKWHNFKEDLIHKGQQVCVQEINKETVLALQLALEEEQTVAAELRAKVLAAAATNEDARTRLRIAKENLKDLDLQIKEQKNNDKKYSAWSDVPLPAGVADRLRKLHSRSNTHPGNEDSS